jgi:acetylornithine aminotransferase
VAQYDRAGTHGTTFGGSPLSCALGFHVLSRVSEPSFVASVIETGAYLQERLSRLPKWFPEVLEPGVRGRGLILGLGLRNKDDPAKLVGMARERGVLLLTAGSDAVRIIPSLNVSREEVDVAVDVLESCLGML